MRAWALLIVGLSGCAVEEWRNADLQLDIAASGLTDESRARVCLVGVGEKEAAVGAGLLSFSGVPVGDDISVVVDGLAADGQRVGRAGPVALGALEPYAWTEWTPCDGDDCPACVVSGELAAESEDAWLLVVRFQD